MKILNTSFAAILMILSIINCNSSPSKKGRSQRTIEIGDIKVNRVSTLKSITIKELRYSCFSDDGSFEFSLSTLPLSQGEKTDLHEYSRKLIEGMVAAFKNSGGEIQHKSVRNVYYGKCAASVSSFTIKYKTQLERTSQILFMFKNKRYVLEQSYFYRRGVGNVPPGLEKTYISMKSEIIRQIS